MGLMPYYQDEGTGITLFLGDCRQVIPELEAIDLLLTDPPYGIKHITSHGASWQGVQIAGDEDTSLRDWVWDFYADKPRAMFGISYKAPPPRDVRCVLIWDKGPAFGAGDMTLPWKPSWEEIYIAGPGWTGRRDQGVLRGPCVPTWESGPAHNGDGRKHPHQKPTWIFSHLLSKQPTAQVILDPFCGSGSTLVAARDMGRRCVGVEISERYAEIAAKRLSQQVFAWD